MKLGRILLLLGRLLTVVVLVASGVYVFVYLVRWEWNRALVAGIFFLAAEAVLLTSLVLARIHALETRVTTAQERAQAAALAARIRANRPESPGPFAWLSPSNTNVLLPILIGAGVILSAVSYVVEQLSRVTAVPIAEDELARGLAYMALPDEGLIPTGRPRPTPEPVRPAAPHTLAWTWLALGGVAAMVTAVIFALVQALLTVPEPADDRRTLRVELVVLTRDLDQPPESVVDALWATCRVRVPQGVEVVSMQALGAPDQFALSLAPAPGISDTLELVGCLQDAVIERARADVVVVDDGSAPTSQLDLAAAWAPTATTPQL